MGSRIKSLISGQLLAKNFFINLLGKGVPTLVALITIPLLIEGMGSERFGLFNLLLVTVGYFSLFELGIGRAITKFVAEALSGGEQENELNQLLWSSFTLLLLLGIFSTILLIGFTPLLVKKILNVPGFLIDEGVTSLIFVSLSLPLMLVSAGVHGILAAQQRFDLINLIQIPFGVSNYLFPLLILLLGSNDLTHAVLSIVFARLIVLAVSIRICFHTLPAIKKVARVSLFYMKKVLTFGGWLTVSNIISPLLSFMDRFFIGAVLTLTAVSYYVVPYTIATKLLLIVGSLAMVLFPAFSYSKNQDQKTNLDLYRRSLKYISLILIPIVLILALFSYDLLALWLGEEFARHSYMVLIILSLAVLVNSLANIPYTLIQAFGRPDITAKFHLAELIPYILLLWLLSAKFGITGVAVAWLVRVSADALLLFWYADRLLTLKAAGQRSMVLFVIMSVVPVAIYLLIMALNLAVPGLISRCVLTLITLILLALGVWQYLLDDGEKSVLKRLKNFRSQDTQSLN
jgi:O-antigen/teichoic acid export membrane protein